MIPTSRLSVANGVDTNYGGNGPTPSLRNYFFLWLSRNCLASRSGRCPLVQKMYSLHCLLFSFKDCPRSRESLLCIQVDCQLMDSSRPWNHMQWPGQRIGYLQCMHAPWLLLKPRLPPDFRACWQSCSCLVDCSMSLRILRWILVAGILKKLVV